ncbi:MAG: hypothetical protein Unbinned664contig1000_24 [Prokaryotic dsDNA virus sp.]|nr:MAG: hypothetical protein Unbinned664contig1000_24 [Prokaryotic dsDNA virus sp.]|tara:strand:- start:20695 stop:20976 length:282 start_codon:yes stop_codon:yes gene_type:complete
MTDVVKMRVIGWAEMKPDMYGGDECDEQIAQWDAYMDGDMDCENLDVLELDASTFPPGTKVTIEVPECPDCGSASDECVCGFDWAKWTEGKYA